jgi:hypothetical protein
MYSITSLLNPSPAVSLVIYWRHTERAFLGTEKEILLKAKGLRI